MTLNAKHKAGQSTVELALLLPVIFGLVFWMIKAYRANAHKAESAMQQHAQALKDFNHGNSGSVVVDGVELIPGRVEEVIPPDVHNGGFFGDLAKGFLSLGINNAFSHLFGDNTNIAKGFLRGSAQNVTEQFVDNGFDSESINWQSARDAGWRGALTSEQATDWFRGTGDISGFNAREFIGSGIQGGLVAYSQGGFKDESQLLGGAIGGLMNSESAENWFGTGNEILKGAARGALASAATGLITGRVELSDVASQAAMGAFYTERVARMLPWSGGENARSSTAFSATNAAVSMLLHQGGKATGSELLLTAATGGLLSGQTQRVFSGNNTGFLPSIQAAALTVGGSAAITSLAHGDSQAIGRSIFYAATSTGGAYGSSAVMNRTRSLFLNSNSTADMNVVMQSPEAEEAFAAEMERRLTIQ